MTESGRPFRQLSSAEARSALYIDFEGVTGQPPVLLGTLRRGGRGGEPFVHQVVVDPVFAATGTETLGFLDAIEIVVVRADLPCPDFDDPDRVRDRNVGGSVRVAYSRSD